MDEEIRGESLVGKETEKNKKKLEKILPRGEKEKWRRIKKKRMYQKLRNWRNTRQSRRHCQYTVIHCFS